MSLTLLNIREHLSVKYVHSYASDFHTNKKTKTILSFKIRYNNCMSTQNLTNQYASLEKINFYTYLMSLYTLYTQIQSPDVSIL